MTLQVLNDFDSIDNVTASQTFEGLGWPDLLLAGVTILIDHEDDIVSGFQHGYHPNHSFFKDQGDSLVLEK